MRSINRLSTVIAAVLMGTAAQRCVTEDAPAAVPVEPAPTVAVTVPAQHESIVQRFVDLLKSGEQWVVDNVEAGLSHFESLLLPAEPATPGVLADQKEEPNA